MLLLRSAVSIVLFYTTESDFLFIVCSPYCVEVLWHFKCYQKSYVFMRDVNIAIYRKRIPSREKKYIFWLSC